MRAVARIGTSSNNIIINIIMIYSNTTHTHDFPSRGTRLVILIPIIHFLWYLFSNSTTFGCAYIYIYVWKDQCMAYIDNVNKDGECGCYKINIL